MIMLGDVLPVGQYLFMATLVLSLTLLIVFIAYKSAVSSVNTRRDAIAAVSAQLGFTFHSQGDFPFPSLLTDFDLFQKGKNRSLANLMTGQVQGRMALVFDYGYWIGDSVVQITVAAFPQVAGTLPDFDLYPKTFLDKMGHAALGQQDIDFDESPRFSSLYVLRGHDEKAIRSAFNRNAIAFFAEHPNWHVAVRNRSFIIFRGGSEYVRPKDLPSFVVESLGVLTTLAPSE